VTRATYATTPRLWLLAPLVTAIGCAGARDQSMLHPVGPAAQQIASLWWVMFAVYGLVFVLTLALFGVALALPRRPGKGPGAAFVVFTGLVVPTVILIAMLFYTVLLTRADRREPSFRVEVIGHRFWWEVRYPDTGPDTEIVDANELHLPVGELVELELRSADVIHGFWAPNLAGKIDLLPDHPTSLRFEIDQPGVYRGQCTEYCGTQHALMALRVVAHEREDLRTWLDGARAADTRTDDLDPAQRRGRQVYLAAGCGDCHRIAGVSQANAGPDLTLFGRRRTLAAGVYANTDANLERWIVDPQAMKPGARMPPTHLSDPELAALIAYLRSLP
jgi:cytochrome c oxidase subunit II